MPPVAIGHWPGSLLYLSYFSLSTPNAAALVLTCLLPSHETADKLQLDPSVPALHYGVQCFEGMKAYKDAQGKVRLFRPELNMKRFHDSCSRLALPDIDEEGMLQSIAKFVSVEQAWVPGVDGCSLYLRPTCIGTVSEICNSLLPAPRFMANP